MAQTYIFISTVCPAVESHCNSVLLHEGEEGLIWHFHSLAFLTAFVVLAFTGIHPENCMSGNNETLHNNINSVSFEYTISDDVSIIECIWKKLSTKKVLQGF